MLYLVNNPKFENLLKEWDYEKNQEVNIKNVPLNEQKTKYWWKCKNGHEWQSTVRNRVRYTMICPHCSNKKSLEINKHNSLEYNCPENILKEWDYDKNKPLTPKDLTYHSLKKVWWKCQKGHEWLTRVKYRTVNNSSCPYCRNLKAC